MRLFFGIELPPAVRAAVVKVADDCRRQVERRAPRARIRWVPPGNLHVTVWFLGEVADTRLPSVTDLLADPFEQGGFPLRLSGLGAFPPQGAMRVVWLGVAEGEAALQSIHRDLCRRLPAAGFPVERRPYSPHLSLARVKDIQTRDAAAVRQILETRDANVKGFGVASLTLFRSRTLPEGSQYEALLRVPLEQGAG